MVAATKFVKEPLQLTGCLDGYDFFEVTPSIGRQYTNLSLRDLLNSPDSDELLREFAIIVSIRGVVFLRDQEMSLEEQKTLTQKLGVLTGKPKESGLYVHPSVRAKIDHVVHAEAQADDQVYLVSNRLTLSRKAFFPEDSDDPTWLKRNRDLGKEWHSEYVALTSLLIQARCGKQCHQIILSSECSGTHLLAATHSGQAASRCTIACHQKCNSIYKA